MKMERTRKASETERTRVIKGELAPAAWENWGIPAEDWVKKGATVRDMKMPPFRLDGRRHRFAEGRLFKSLEWKQWL